MTTCLTNPYRATPLCLILAAGLCGVCLPTQAADVSLTQVTVDENLPRKPYYKMVGDINGAEMHQGDDPDEVSVLLNQSAGAAWRKQVISTQGSHDIVVADNDNDGDLDIIGANHSGKSHPLELWRNELR